MEKGPFVSIPRVSFKSEGMQPQAEGEKSVSDRQEMISGWVQSRVKEARITCVGAGGLGSHALQSMARIGVKVLRVCDADQIELSNLNRQFYHYGQLYQNKALTMAENLIRECTGETVIEGYSMDFQNAVREFPDAFKNTDVLLCLVDNDESRYDISRYAFERKIPVVFAAISDTASNGYVFLQDNKSGCFSCLWDTEKGEDEERMFCVAPSAIYIHAILGGMAVYQTMAVLMDWEVPWRYWEVFLDGDTRAFTPEKIKDCRICGEPKTSTEAAPEVEAAGEEQE